MRALRKKMTMGGGLLLAFCLATVLGFAYTLTSPTSSLAEEPAAAGESATSASWADAVVEAAEGQLTPSWTRARAGTSSSSPTA